MPPALRALSAQFGAWACVWLLAQADLLPHGLWPVVAVQSACAIVLSQCLGSARWWIVIHAAFTPLLVIANRLNLPPALYLLAFVALAAIYWSSFRTQVPLFLSNRQTVAALLKLLPQQRTAHMLDLGSGTGSVLIPLARVRPDCRFTGVEIAPAPLLWARWRSRGLHNIHWHRQDFNELSWRDADVVYAFLSPVPMPAVWVKAVAEMPANSVLVSNSFAIPDITPDQIIHVADRRNTVLYLYHPHHHAKSARVKNG